MLSTFRLLLLSLLFGGLLIRSVRAQQFMLPPAERQINQPPGVNLLAFFMAEDASGYLWLGSPNGLIRCDGQQLRLFHASAQPQDDSYGRVAAGTDGRIWLRYDYGDNANRLAYVDRKAQRVDFVSDTTRLVRDFLAKDGMRALFVDRRGQLWIGLYGSGLLRVDPNTLAVDPVLPQKVRVNDVAEGPDGHLWLATTAGLYRLDPRTRRVRRYRHDARLPGSLGSDTLSAVRVRSNGDVLLGLYNELNVLTPATGQIRRIRWPLPTPTSRMWTNRIVIDHRDNAYFSVGLMVFRLTPPGELQRIEFAHPAEKVISIGISQSPRLGADRLWVNAGRRLYAYDLSRLRPVPSLNLLDVTVNGTRLIQNEQQREERFRRDSTGQPRVVVQEGDFVQLRFTPYVESKSSSFRYRLDGYDQQWTAYTDELGIVTYQPPAGTYAFVLNRAKRTGGWEPQVARLLIRVEPPFWKTGWFLVLVLTGFGGVGVWVARSWNRRRHLRQELDRQAFDAATLREMDTVKSGFFANVTHEFRTPLTIILNATEQLAATSLDQRQRGQVGSVQHHAQQLLRLVTETLDMARLDAGKLESHPQLGNPLVFIGQVVAQFRGLADPRGIELTWTAEGHDDTPADRLYRFDGDKWEKIAYNLLANALKFTPDGGRVAVTGRVVEANCFTLRVADTGIGIPADQLTRIFERFHQVDASSTRAYSGTGIGLALVKELTDWLGGRVAVESEVGRGSVFTVELPLTPPESVSRVNAESAPSSLSSPVEKADRPLRTALTEPAQRRTDKPLVLVVEDNADLRAQVVNYLSAQYRMRTASTGRQGLEQALAEIPDLIVSDVMMPEMDGYELTERLKTDERTSHIPLVLLTARSSPDSRLKGLQAGADEYLGKPFSLAELALRIGNALRTRQNWQKQFTGGPVPATVALPTPSEPRINREERFLSRLRQRILEHIDTETLDVDWLATQAGMSRMQLHRKLTALTGLSPNRFIHRVRLERAVELLQTGELNVAQVAYQVGYGSQSYFAKVFQEHFGYAPAKLKG